MKITYKETDNSGGRYPIRTYYDRITFLIPRFHVQYSYFVDGNRYTNGVWNNGKLFSTTLVPQFEWYNLDVGSPIVVKYDEQYHFIYFSAYFYCNPASSCIACESSPVSVFLLFTSIKIPHVFVLACSAGLTGFALFRLAKLR